MKITRELAEALREKFNARVDKNGPLLPRMRSRCHVWVGGTGSKQYGRISVKHVHEVLVHRLAWVLNFGLIPDGLHVLHRCDNPPCVRKEHLFLGTNLDNIADKTAKGRQSKGVGAGRNKTTGLVDADVIEIRRLRGLGASLDDLAKMYDVTLSTIGAIVRNKTWKHLPPCEIVDCRSLKFRQSRIDSGARPPNSWWRKDGPYSTSPTPRASSSTRSTRGPR
jgi:hypothetical protein